MRPVAVDCDGFVLDTLVDEIANHASIVLVHIRTISIENAHNALYDTLATLEVLQAQTERYQDLSNDIAGLAKFSTIGDNQRADFASRLCYNEQNLLCYNFGKHKGKTIERVLKEEPGYYGWMLEADFPLNTKQLLRQEVERLKDAALGTNLEDKLDLLKNKFKKP